MKALFPVPVSIELAIRRILASLPLALLGPLAQGQNIDQPMSTNNPPPAPVVSRTQQALVRDAISTTWEVLEQTFYPATGIVASRTNRYVELGDGLNYLSDPSTGQWAPSEDLIQLMPDGSAAALKGPTKLYLKPNLNSPGAVRIVSDSAVFQTRPLGLFWYDPASGNASLIAPAQDCAGELEPPNQVVYKGAFGEVGDLRLTYTKGAIESDLVLLECPQLPPGFDPATARLELWHACQPTTAPKITPRSVGAEAATDDVLDLGGLWFPTGAAYWSDGSRRRATDTPAAVRVPTLTEDGTLAPICKTWLSVAGEDVLVEALAWNAVAAKLSALPPTPVTYLSPPALDRSSWLAKLVAAQGASSTSPTVIRQGVGYQPLGLVWDYITVTGGTSYTFATGQTYYIGSFVSFNKYVTLNPCVIKFNSGATLDVQMADDIICNGSSSSPTIFTSWQDDLFGTQIQPYQPCPLQAAACALQTYSYGQAHLTGLRFRWANTALALASNPRYQSAPVVSNCSFEFCGVGISAAYCSVTIASSTMCSVATPTQLGTGGSFTGSLTDVCSGNVDSDGNGLPDLLDYRYFGRLGTLPGNLLGQVTTWTQNRSPGQTYQQIWSPEDPVGINYQYNGNCWLYGARGLSALSPWHSSTAPQQGAGTLITPRHAVTVSEWPIAPNTPYLFVGYDNSYHWVYAAASETLPCNPNYAVVLFTNDVPNVEYVKVMPDFRPKMTSMMVNNSGTCYPQVVAPCVVTDQAEWAYINDLYNLLDGSVSLLHSQSFLGWGSAWYVSGQPNTYCGIGEDRTQGDCGHPTFFLINGELVLFGPLYDCTTAAWPGRFTDEINTAIADLDNLAWNTYHIPRSGYTATRYDLSGFPDLW